MLGEARKLRTQVRDEPLHVREMCLLRAQDQVERVPLQRRHVELRQRLRAGRIADDVDQAVHRVQPPPQIVVLAERSREERAEVHEGGALERSDRAAPEGAGVLRADAVDADLVELAQVAPAVLEVLLHGRAGYATIASSC